MHRLNEIIAKLELRAEQLMIHLKMTSGDTRETAAVRTHLHFLLLKLRRYKDIRKALKESVKVKRVA